MSWKDKASRFAGTCSSDWNHALPEAHPRLLTRMFLCRLQSVLPPRAPLLIVLRLLLFIPPVICAVMIPLDIEPSPSLSSTGFQLK